MLVSVPVLPLPLLSKVVAAVAEVQTVRRRGLKEEKRGEGERLRPILI